MPELGSGCVYACWSPTMCPTCRRNMAPRGRSVPMEAASGFCQCDHASDPAMNPRHLWNMHDSDRAYTDPFGWSAHVGCCLQCAGESVETAR